MSYTCFYEQRNNGTTEQRNNGTTEQRNNGTTEQRNNGTNEKLDKLLDKYGDVLDGNGEVETVDSIMLMIQIYKEDMNVVSKYSKQEFKEGHYKDEFYSNYPKEIIDTIVDGVYGVGEVKESINNSAIKTGGKKSLAINMTNIDVDAVVDNTIKLLEEIKEKQQAVIKYDNEVNDVERQVNNMEIEIKKNITLAVDDNTEYKTKKLDLVFKFMIGIVGVTCVIICSICNLAWWVGFIIFICLFVIAVTIRDIIYREKVRLSKDIELKKRHKELQEKLIEIKTHAEESKKKFYNGKGSLYYNNHDYSEVLMLLNLTLDNKVLHYNLPEITIDTCVRGFKGFTYQVIKPTDIDPTCSDAWDNNQFSNNINRFKEYAYSALKQPVIKEQIMMAAKEKHHIIDLLYTVNETEYEQVFLVELEKYGKQHKYEIDAEIRQREEQAYRQKMVDLAERQIREQREAFMEQREAENKREQTCPMCGRYTSNSYAPCNDCRRGY